MVQKKVAKPNNKLENTCKTEKKQAVIKPLFQNHDCKSKGADLKSIKMKKSRSVKRSNIDIRLPFVTQAQTPSPMKPPLPCKSPYTSPNYMKSTTSSEARKEKISNILSTSKVHNRVAKTLTKTSTFDKMRTLTKAPSFKYTRSTTVACQKAVFCQSNLELQKATCSSTLKDSKFPSYLKLKHVATEAEGNSVFKVCPYKYCSLNGHHHASALPLKRFLMSSRRKMMKPLKFAPLECNNKENDLFVEVYVPNRKIEAQTSECLSDEPCSEIIESYYEETPIIEKQTSIESLSLSFGEDDSDMEWEEGQSNVTYEKCEMVVQTEYTKDGDKAEFEVNNGNGGGYLEFLDEDYSSCFHDEIVECMCFSDSDSLTDSESSHTGDKQADDKNSKPSKEITEHFEFLYEGTVCAAKHEDESIRKHGETFSDIFEEITEPRNEELVSKKYIDEVVMEESEPSEDLSKITDHFETETNQSGNEARKCVSKRLIKRSRIKVDEEEKEFNPREPNFLAAETEPETEKVDLRHQEMDERRNAEDWMLDHALQKTVHQLAPARKRKVALLVEAFESVLPLPLLMCESNTRRSSSGFAHLRTLQACS